MIFYKDEKIKERIESDYEELENYKKSYIKRISLYNRYLDTLQIFENAIDKKNDLNKEEIENKKQIFQTQINKIDSSLELLAIALKNIETTGEIGIEKNKINRYNQKYKEIRNNYVKNSVFEEDITEKYISELMTDLTKTLEKMKEEHTKEMEKILVEKENTQYVTDKNENIIQEDQTDKNENIIQENQTDKNEDIIQEDQTDKKENIIQENQIVSNIEEKKTHIKNNNTLLISEKQGKVILPYKAEEVLEIFNNGEKKYNSEEEVIEEKFTRNFSDYKVQFASRYAETMKLARDRENYSLIDAVTIATEMMKKRFLHPAIISACRTLNELDVYLDCLDKNELEDFKIFKVKYELYPMVVKSYKNGKRAKHKETSNLKILKRYKKYF